MRLLFFMIFLSISSVASALTCNPEGSQLEMNQCALDDFTQADKQLNKTWKQLLAKSGDNKAYIDKLRVAQRAWISFRDAEVAAMFVCGSEHPRVCWGSMYPLLYHIEMTELTEQRTKRLQKYFKDGQNPAVDE